MIRFGHLCWFIFSGGEAVCDVAAPFCGELYELLVWLRGSRFQWWWIKSVETIWRTKCWTSWVLAVRWGGIWSVNGGCNGEKTMVCLRKLSCHFAAISENCTSPLLQCHLNIILTNQCCSTGSFREGEVGRYWEGQVKEVSIYVCAPLVSSCSQPQL